ncbi:unnamed protein product [Ambrosiozyma monospora]|uniref:Unnamed protein product n=1 Tax=Ambrosiozyma monospora TaxID=43982 RepID=A0ACB5TB25_AMBMO|nr:unnamed protein product [Ambrosiozyma monospora]
MSGFISSFSSIARKLLTLKSLTMYWTTENESIYTDDHDALLEIFKSIIKRNSDNDPLTQFILRPVSGYGHLTVNKRGATDDAPHYNVNLFFNEFSVDLDSNQYKDMIWTTSQIDWYMKTHRFRKLRPKISIEEDPKQWLRYAFKCVYDEIHERNYKWTWDYFKTRREQRKAYVKLWKATLGDGMLTPEQKKELGDLEIVIEYDDIKFYRSIARMEYRRDFKALPVAPKPQPQQTGWLSSWWGGSNANANANQDQKAADDLKLTEEQRDELYDAIEFDESKELSDVLDMPRERVIISVGCTLQKGSFSIKKKKNENNLAEFVFEGCNSTYLQRKDSSFIDFKLKEFRVEDGSESALYKHVVSIKPLNPEISHASTPTEDKSEDGKINADPFFDVSFESNPLDDSADSKLMLKMNSMTIFHNPRFIEEIARFFKPPKTNFDNITALMNAAETQDPELFDGFAGTVDYHSY